MRRTSVQLEAERRLASRSKGVHAAEYLRTSCWEQGCSIDTQKRAIREYASRYGFEITRTYIDEGKSGLTLRARPGLSALLRDIVYGMNAFHAVLVYDISRWGRFQDCDESAHYEFVCKALNVQIHYCAESFANSDELSAFIIKSLKRTIAAEHSREMSEKIFRAQKRLNEEGFNGGGKCPYGMRRMAVSRDGSRKQLLQSGERKSIASDRVILVPGPTEEVAVVQRIFALAAKNHLSCAGIADVLNRRGIPYKRGLPWPDYAIDRMLRNKRYIGWNVWNRTTSKLGTLKRKNASDQWVVVPRSFPAIIDEATFERARQSRRCSTRSTQEQLLEAVKRLNSYDSSCLTRWPSYCTLRRRLVGLVGIPSLRSSRGTSLKGANTHPNTRQRMVIFRNEIFDTLIELFPKKLSEFHLTRKSRPMLKLDNGLSVSVIVCGRVARKSDMLRWRFQVALAEKNFITLIGLECPGGMQYYLVPRVDVLRDCFIGTDHLLFRTGVRLNSLADFYDAVTAFLLPLGMA